MSSEIKTKLVGISISRRRTVNGETMYNESNRLSKSESCFHRSPANPSHGAVANALLEASLPKSTVLRRKGKPCSQGECAGVFLRIEGERHVDGGHTQPTDPAFRLFGTKEDRRLGWTKIMGRRGRIRHLVLTHRTRIAATKRRMIFRRQERRARG